MEYFRSFQQNYVPKITQIWENLQKDQDEIDGLPCNKKAPTFFERLEPFLVQLQEFGLWTNPSNSVMALMAFHVLYFFLTFWCSSLLYTAAWACIIGFVYTTWTQRVWPVIRVEETEEEKADSEGFTPMHPECLTAPEMSQKFAQFQEKVWQSLHKLRSMRKERPGKFCGVLCSCFGLLAFFGQYLSILGLVYYTGLSILTLPALLNYLKQFPALNGHLENFLGSSEKVSDKKLVSEEISDKGIAQPPTGYLEQIVAQGSTFMSDISKVLNSDRKDNNEEDEKETEDEFGLSQTDKEILDEIDSPMSEARGDEESLLVKISENERTTEINRLTNLSSEEKQQQIDSLSPFTSGLESIPSHEEEIENEHLQLSTDQIGNQLMLVGDGDGKSGDHHGSQHDDEEFLPKEESLPSFSESQENDSDAEDDLISEQPKLSLDIDRGSSSSEEEEDKDLKDKKIKKQEEPPQQQPEIEMKPSVSMLESALEESSGSSKRSSQSSEEDFSNSEEFEVITQEELKLAGEKK